MPWKRLTAQKAADRLAEMTGLPVERVKDLLRAQAQLAYAEAGNGFPFPGIGTLKKRETPERQGRNPMTGQPVTIRAKQVTKFRVSRLAKEMAMDPSQPLPDIFKTPEVPEFAFCVDATEVGARSPLIAGLGGAFATANGGEPGSMTFYRLPDLHIPTGRICAADPMLLSGTLPFAQTVPPGRYALILAAAHVEVHRRIALAILRFSEDPVVRWEVASTSRQTPGSGLAVREGYGVDTATGCFCDEAIVQLLDAAEDIEGEFFERLSAEMSESWKSGRAWLSAESPSGSLAAFSSGSGDGFFTSYFGFDRDDAPAALVTNFEIVRWPPVPPG